MFLYTTNYAHFSVVYCIYLAAFVIVKYQEAMFFTNMLESVSAHIYHT